MPFRKIRKTATAWKTDGGWKARYSQLYHTHHLLQPKEDPIHRISFLSNDNTNHAISTILRMRTNRDSPAPDVDANADIKTLLSQRSEVYGSCMSGLRSNSIDESATVLLDLVRARNQSAEIHDKIMDLPAAARASDDDENIEPCVHGYVGMRMTDRSVSRSRVSRVSTRRDMDIPSILAFQANPPPASASQGIPAFKKGSTAKVDDVPKWSIRRSVCPVCSQRWKDKSSIHIVKNSGLKRNSLPEFPSVIAPARLRAQITKDYFPRPALASIDESTSSIRRALRNTSTSWQFTRARRFRIPKLQMPPPEDRAPPSVTAPMARKDLKGRVNRFLKDEGIASYYF